MQVNVLDRATITQTQRWCWFPTVQKFSTGEVLAAFWMSPDENDAESMMNGFCLSPDGGRTWGARFTKGDGGHSRFPFDDGAMLELGYHSVVESPEQATEFRVTRILYRDGGRAFAQSFGKLTLPEPARLTPPSPFRREQTGSRSHSGFLFDHTILRARDGALLATMYGRWARDTFYRSILVRSADEGHAWAYRSTIACVEGNPPEGMGKEGPCEPTMARLANGDLFCLMRTGGDGMMWQCRSSDDGLTWSEPQSAGIKGVQPDLCLLSNGVLVCSYGRPGPVSVAFSADGTGSEWANVTPIFTERSTCYTAMVEVEPNVVLVVYDHVPQGWEPIGEAGTVNSIQSVLIWVER